MKPNLTKTLCLFLTTLTVFLGTLLTTYGCHANAQSTAQTDSYQIHVAPTLGTLAVQAKLYNIRTNEAFCLPAFGQRYGEHFENLRITSDGVEPVQIKPDKTGCFVTREPLDQLVFTYNLAMDGLAPGHYWQASGLSAYHNENVLIFPGESVFIDRTAGHSVDSKRKTNVSITGYPHQWPLITTLNTQDDPKAHHYYAQSSSELIHSYWAYGMMHTLSGQYEDISWTIAVDSKWKSDIDKTSEDLQTLLRHYHKLISDRTPNHLSVLIFPAEFDTNYQHGFARPNGLIIQMGSKSAQDDEDRRLLIAHELFHLYNGESLRYDASDYTETAWIREGATQYIALQTLLSLNMISMKFLHQWVLQCVYNLQNGVQTHKHSKTSDLAYYRGFFLSMMLDNIWSGHHNPSTIQKFFQWLARNPSWNTPQTNNSMKTALEKYSGENLSGFFHQYISGNKELPLKSMLSANQMCLAESHSIQYHVGMSYRFDAVTARIVAEAITPNGIADRAGIRPGDILIPDPQTDWSDDSFKQFIRLRHGQSTQVRLPVLSASVPTYEIRPCRR